MHHESPSAALFSHTLRLVWYGRNPIILLTISDIKDSRPFGHCPFAETKISSEKTNTKSRRNDLKTKFMSAWKVAGALVKAKGMTKNS